MLQKDLVLRMIQQAVDTVLKLMKLVDNHDDEQFFVDFDRFLEGELGLSVTKINQQNAREISDEIIQLTEFLEAKNYLVDLFLSVSQMQLFEIENRIGFFELALQINLNPTKSRTVSLFDGNRIKAEKAKVNEISHDPAFFEKCSTSVLNYYLSIDQIAAYEDLLFGHLTSKIASDQLRKIGNRFYDSISKFDEVRLRKGNFSIAEIDEGRKRLVNEFAS